MANTFFKVNKVNTNSDVSFSSKYDREYREFFNSNMNDDLYSLVSGMHKNKLRSSNIDINTLLKCYIINKLIDTPEKENNDIFNNLRNTPNPNIKKDLQDNYYKITNGKPELDNNIKSVLNDGSYTVHEIRQYCPFKIIRTYNIDSQPIMMQICSLKGDALSDKWQIAEILNLKQEFKTKHKYSGYSGNSKEIIAKVLNKFSKPLPTGFYMDSKCLIWKWSYKNLCFERVFEREEELPLMSDIEFRNDGIVIRQEYKGIAS